MNMNDGKFNGDGESPPEDVDATFRLPPRTQSHHGSLIGRTVSHYKILRELGAGGMGVVYEALDINLDRTVALKFLSPESTRDPDAKARFIQEAKAASALDHPNVCTIHEIGETNDGQLFLAMASYKGQTLKVRIAQGPLPLDEALHIARQVAEGLAETHAREIVHRDIKPANIFITDSGLVKILDFGVAKLSGLTQLTQEGTTLGTAHYMSPEQAKGGEADKQTDLWSLGVILYEMLTGLLPFPGGHPQVVINAILNLEPEPMANHLADVEPSITGIVDKCIAKQTDQRYQAAEDLVADLSLLQRGTETGVSAAKMMPGGTHRRIWRRWLIWVCALVVFVVGAVGWQMLIGGSKDISDSNQALAVIGFRFLQSRDNDTESAALSSLVNVGLVESSPVRVVSASYLHDLRRRLFGSAQGLIAEDQAIEVARACGASLLLSGGITMLGSEQIVTWQLVDTRNGKSVGADRIVGGDLIEAADRVVAGVLLLLVREPQRGRLAEAPSVASLATRSSDSYRLYVAGVRALEEQMFDAALDSLERAVAIDSTFAMAHLELSRLYQLRLGGIGDTRGIHRHAEAAWKYRSNLGRKDRMRVESWQAQRESRFADVHEIFGKMRSEWPDDREIILDWLDFLYYHWYFRAALQEAEQALESYPDDLSLMEYHHILLSALGEHDRALKVVQRCIEIEPEKAVHYHQLCACWLATGKPDSAESAARLALSLKPGYLIARIQIAQCLYARGDLEKATRLLEEIAQEVDIDPLDAVRVLTSSSFRPSLAMLYGESGRHGAALASFGRAEGLAQSAPTRLAIESRRHRYLLRQGWYQETLAWSNRILSGQSNDGSKFNAQLNRVVALALVDSIEASRRGVAELEVAADTQGRLSIFMARRGTITLLLREQKPKEALAVIREIRFDGLPNGGMFDIEIRDAEIKALLQEKRFHEAERALREQLRFYGGHSRAHLTLAQTLEEQGNYSEAAEHYNIFLEAWAKADPDQPQIVTAKESLHRLGYTQ